MNAGKNDIFGISSGVPLAEYSLFRILFLRRRFESRAYGLADSRSSSSRTLGALQPAHAKKKSK
ncbi:hypothetical protein EHQ97_07700 [Leptospira adleri]|nr:hypothetical protein EHQ97_07700 [Leptospira adleri]